MFGGTSADAGSELLDAGPEVPLSFDGAAELLRAVRVGLMTLKEAIARQGYDPAHVLAEIGATNAELDALGIVLDTDPRRATKTGAAVASAQTLPSPMEENEDE